MCVGMPVRASRCVCRVTKLSVEGEQWSPGLRAPELVQTAAGAFSFRPTIKLPHHVQAHGSIGR